MNKSVSVELIATQEGVIQETIYATGKLGSTKETLLHIQQSGTIQQVAIQLGDRVTTGQSLLIMDTKDSEDQLLIEENNKMIIVTERELFKKQKLVTAKEKLQEGVDPKDIIDPGEIELYALRLEAVELSIAALEENIASNHLQATVDGVVT